MKRRTAVFASAGLTAAMTLVAVAGSWWFLSANETCACVPRPAATVNGARYEVSFQSVDLVNVEGHSTSYGTAVSDYDGFAEPTAYALDGVDPALYLIVPNAKSSSAPGEYRELWGLPKHRFPIGLCQYFPDDRTSAYPVCQSQ